MEKMESNSDIKCLLVFDILHDIDNYKILSFNSIINGEIEENIFMGSSKPKKFFLQVGNESSVIGSDVVEGAVYDDLVFDLVNNHYVKDDKVYKFLEDDALIDYLLLINEKPYELFFLFNEEIYSVYDFMNDGVRDIDYANDFTLNEEDFTKNLPPIKELEAKINKKVIGQSSAIKLILSALYSSYKYGVKTNLLVSGPTGVGKSEIFKIIAEELSVPFMFEDATDYTAPGYHGKDISSLIDDIMLKNDYNIAAAEKTMIVFDEIDKKMGGDSDSVNTKQSLNNMLCLLGSNKMTLSDSEYDSFDTKNLFIVCLGAFTDIRKSKQATKAGFLNSSVDGENVKAVKFDGNVVNYDNLIKAGMSEEFAGRLDKFIELNELTKKDLLEILVKSEISPLKVYTDLLNEKGVKLMITADHLAEIVNLAYKMKTGARALKMVVGKLFEDFIYLIESEENLRTIVVNSIEVTDNDYKLNYTCETKIPAAIKTSSKKRRVKKR